MPVIHINCAEIQLHSYYLAIAREMVPATICSSGVVVASWVPFEQTEQSRLLEISPHTALCAVLAWAQSMAGWEKDPIPLCKETTNELLQLSSAGAILPEKCNLQAYGLPLLSHLNVV
jgi:hypothetical protein